MLDRTKHEITMRNILDALYSHKTLSPLLGFKGGTACYFFYGLPRFSTDLDFNLLAAQNKQMVFETLPDILSRFGTITDRHIKTNTIFFYLVHTPRRSGIKIEISTRTIEKINHYALREFYGTTLLVMKKEDIFANKLLALRKRITPASRDLFDINFFFQQNWDITESIIEKITGKKTVEYLQELIPFIKKTFNYKTIHLGLGELVETESSRNFIKTKLIDDTINRIQFYGDAQKRNSDVT